MKGFSNKLQVIIQIYNKEVRSDLSLITKIIMTVTTSKARFTMITLWKLTRKKMQQPPQHVVHRKLPSTFQKQKLY